MRSHILCTVVIISDLADVTAGRMIRIADGKHTARREILSIVENLRRMRNISRRLIPAIRTRLLTASKSHHRRSRKDHQ